jgi:CTP:molybdopterin cytidylyltransferase MocA
MTVARVTILIPAAGRSSRMRGRDKLMQDVGGVSLLARQVGRALSTGAPVIVTLPPGDTPRRAVLDRLAHDRLTQVTVADAAEGMAASLRAGVATLDPDAEAVMILLPDMPDLTTSDMTLMIVAQGAAPDRVLQATSADGQPGHPVILPRRMFPAIAALRGDRGAKSLLAADRPQQIALADRRALVDLDTPEDWQAWRDSGR